jgi:hypothetical protein
MLDLELAGPGSQPSLNWLDVVELLDKPPRD